MTVPHLTYSDSQQEVINFLKALPDPDHVSILFRSRINPSTGRNNGEIEIRGGSNVPDDEPCDKCGHKEYRTNISVRFYWRKGRFWKAEVWTGSRRTVKSIEQAIQMTRNYVERYDVNKVAT